MRLLAASVTFSTPSQHGKFESVDVYAEGNSSQKLGKVLRKCHPFESPLFEGQIERPPQGPRFISNL